MFKLTYRPKHDRDHAVTEYFNDIKSLGQALINIVDNEKEEQSAMDWCGRAHWGDKVVRQQFGYKIECFNEEALKKGTDTYSTRNKNKNVDVRTFKNIANKLEKTNEQTQIILYNDGLWRIEYERYYNGNDCFWIFRNRSTRAEYTQLRFTRENFNNDGSLSIQTPIKIKKSILDKLANYYRVISN